MAPITHLFTRLAATAATPSPAVTTSPYPAAIILATLSLLVILLLVSPLCWHYRNRNVGATLLVAWAIVINLQTFINSILWQNDDITNWYNGAGLCDVEVKLQIASSIAAPAALAAVLRALANAIDTERATLVKSRAQRIRDYAIDISFCLGFPALEMLFHYIDQPSRYLLVGIAGCGQTVSLTWVTTLLSDIPPMLWTLLDMYYAVVILIRLCRYRATMSSILASSNISKTRFLRLYMFCIILILAFVPLQAFTLYQNQAQPDMQYKWSEVHDPTQWNNIIMAPSGGRVSPFPCIWLAGGFFIFIFFGLGKDAMAMYRSGLLAMGFEKVFPSLKPGYTPNDTGMISSFGSKAKLMFKRKDSRSSWLSQATTSGTTSTTDFASPKTMAMLETIEEHEHNRSSGGWLASFFKRQSHGQGHALSEVGQHSTVGSNVSAADGRNTGGIEVIVRREVRQASETAETAPPVALYHVV
ncbi:a-factor receptor [Elasticomyces elasticus]|nr:a-factor receptor [Elasticomyces elasticus]KAK3660523.1 a-factor receptor [Elasticomyces elasticus]KAK5754819.1 a-factor receptor [Elasticomyces elasticus]